MSSLRGEGESPPCCRRGSSGEHEETGLTDQGGITPEARAGDQMGKETWTRIHVKTQGQGFRRESKGASKEQRLSGASQHFAGNSCSCQRTHKTIIHPTDFANKGKTGAAGGH